MKEITLTRGKVAIVDDVAFDFLQQWKWCAVQPHPGGTFYAARHQWVAHKKYQTVYMHQIVSGFLKPDHKDGNGLNNQLVNLRPCSSSLNNGNAKMHRDNKAGFKGVSLDARNKTPTWAVSVNYEGKKHYVGRFATAREAALAYDKKAQELFGGFARTNADLGLL